jgi:hypothetical protein
MSASLVQIWSCGSGSELESSVIRSAFSVLASIERFSVVKQLDLAPGQLGDARRRRTTRHRQRKALRSRALQLRSVIDWGVMSKRKRASQRTVAPSRPRRDQESSERPSDAHDGLNALDIAALLIATYTVFNDPFTGSGKWKPWGMPSPSLVLVILGAYLLTGRSRQALKRNRPHLVAVSATFGAISCIWFAWPIQVAYDHWLSRMTAMENGNWASRTSLALGLAVAVGLYQFVRRAPKGAELPPRPVIAALAAVFVLAFMFTVVGGLIGRSLG